MQRSLFLFQPIQALSHLNTQSLNKVVNTSSRLYDLAMAPTPVGDNLNAEPSSRPKPQKYWTKANIATTTVFSVLTLGVIIAVLSFILYRHHQKKKRETQKSDKAGLLANEDKTSMFSRHRASSVTLYVDSEADAHSKRASTDTMSLVPLHVTPVEESRDPMNNNSTSTGSGVSAMSRSTNNTTLSSMLLSPMSPGAEEGDLGIRPSGRPRSTSTASQRARYYEATPMNIEMPPIPKIIRTPSD